MSPDASIETERLSLAPLSAGDLDGVHEIFSDPVAMSHSITGVRDREQTADWLSRVMERFRADGCGFLAARLKATGEYAGHAGLLAQTVDGVAETEIAYWFVRRFWNRGLASEAAVALRRYGFDVLGARRLVSLIRPDNLASIRVAEKTGLLFEREVVWRDTPVRVYSVSAPSGA